MQDLFKRTIWNKNLSEIGNNKHGGFRAELILSNDALSHTELNG